MENCGVCDKWGCRGAVYDCLWDEWGRGENRGCSRWLLMGKMGLKGKMGRVKNSSPVLGEVVEDRRGRAC